MTPVPRPGNLEVELRASAADATLSMFRARQLLVAAAAALSTKPGAPPADPSNHGPSVVRPRWHVVLAFVIGLALMWIALRSWPFAPAYACKGYSGGGYTCVRR